MSDVPDRDPLLDRISALEKAVEGLGRELSEVRWLLGRRAPAPAAIATDPNEESPSAPREAPVVQALPATPLSRPPAKPELDLETLVGRYGMLALATVLALAAAGTFVGWAIAHGLLGPTVRVALGLLAALALAVWGLRLRRRERPFGDSILGLSLAIIHVCAWAAGPSLHLVPPVVALVFSAAASVALAGFALVEEDEPLWCVGFGGASLAPFVTSTGQGTAPMLAAYGAAVLIAGGSALASRPWRVAARVFGLGAALFTLAILAMPLHQHSAELALALPFVAGGFGVLPFARGAILRPRLRTLGLLAAVAALRLAAFGRLEPALAALWSGAAAALWLLALERFDTEPAGTLLDGFGEAGTDLPDWIDGGLIPGAFAIALGCTFDLRNPAFALWGVAATVTAFVASRREGALRDALALVSYLCANTAILVFAWTPGPLAVAAIAGNALLFTLLAAPVPNGSWRWAPQFALVLAGVAALVFLTVRPSYEYTPFLTRESLAAFAVLACWALAVVLSGFQGVRAALFAFGFLWVHQELAWAVNPSASTLLLVTWYAASSVACVGLGRARKAAKLRHVGLGLGVLAALLALKAAWGFSSTATRIGAYLVVSAFLLGIAWWYRHPGAERSPEAA
ncbi:MAG TPA: DUF2339 domain-containing protein [Myxococcales bacterium]|nr:DUF2339 domain-containing protein [Myxococcales bacterium]